ncbi:SHD1 domain-containing protein, partial [Akkermansiaceae bacterium]|nr:SHD1 domain-containing protein [Akkermansiaceae bacterium]
MKFWPLAILLFALSSYAGAVEPTELRIWTSKSGSKISAKAIEMTKNGAIQLITKDGRELTLGIDEFSEQDQAFLEKHFKK